MLKQITILAACAALLGACQPSPETKNETLTEVKQQEAPAVEKSPAEPAVGMASDYQYLQTKLDRKTGRLECQSTRRQEKNVC